MAEQRGFREGWSSSKDNEDRLGANANLAESNSIIAGRRKEKN